MQFEQLPLSDNVLDALWDMHFENCTPIQEQCIPHILEGNDILAVAQTGTGKTATYLLPILSLLDEGNFPTDSINCIVMSPTRELAQQIDQAMQGFGYYLPDISSVAVYGGNDAERYSTETRSLQQGADVVIATPGRLITHINMEHADLSKTSFFVLDEADRMLDMGFSEDILFIANQLPKDCQVLMFSATMPDKIEELAKTLLKNPVEVKLKVTKPAERIQQSAYVCYNPQKISLVTRIIQEKQLSRSIIFTGKKRTVKELAIALQRKKINCGAMHSDLSQAERDEIMYKFKSGQIDILCATDIVARGIDIDDISAVINFDVPHDTEDYVHRIGRTARAARSGIAITLVNEDDILFFKRIEKDLEDTIQKNPIPAVLGEGPDYDSVKAPKRGGSHAKGRQGGNSRRGQGKNHRGKGKSNKATSSGKEKHNCNSEGNNKVEKKTKATKEDKHNSKSAQSLIREGSSKHGSHHYKNNRNNTSDKSPKTQQN